jgi:hypothetical protein
MTQFSDTPTPNARTTAQRERRHRERAIKEVFGLLPQQTRLTRQEAQRARRARERIALRTREDKVWQEVWNELGWSRE